MLLETHSDRIDMKATWSFPALVRAIPPNPKEERVCLVSKDDEFEIKEVDITSMPLVMTATIHCEPEEIEYRLLNGQLYRLIENSDEILEIENDCSDTLGAGFTWVYREMADEIIDIMKSGTVNIWPKNAAANRQKGTKNIDDSGIRLTPEGETDLAYWRERFKQHLERFVMAGGKTWMKTAEPIWSVDFGYKHAIIDYASCFSNKRDEFGERHYATGREAAKHRIFSMLEYDAMSSLLEFMETDHDAKVTEIMDSVKIFMPEAFQVDVDRLEMDRMARAVAEHVGKALSYVKPGGGETLLEVAPTSLVVTWGRLRDFVKSYNPLEGVPDELERKFADFMAEANGMEAVYGPTLIKPPLRDAIDYAFERWENRAIDIAAAPLFAVK